MKTINHHFIGYDELEAFLRLNKLDESRTLLIQYFDGELNQSNTKELLEYLKKRLPFSSIIGTSTDGEIIDNTIQNSSVILSFTAFEAVEIQSLMIPLIQGSEEAGKVLGNAASSFGAQAIIVFSDPFSTNGDLLVEGFNQTSKDAILSGGMAGDNGRFQGTYVMLENELYSNTLVALMIKGKNLRVQSGYSFHWLPIGPKFLVTDSIDSKVYTLNHTPIMDIYRQYLGDTVADTLPSVGVAFPLILTIEGILVGRAPLKLYPDGALQFGGSIPEGTEVQLGIGNAHLILDASHEIMEDLYHFAPESIFVYSCMARRRFLGDSIVRETAPMTKMSAVSGFFTYGEFYTDPISRQTSFLNETMTYITLSETLSESSCSVSKKENDPQDWSLITFSALSHLINKTSNDLQEVNHTLQHRIDKEIDESRAKDKVMISQSRMAIMGEMIGMIAHQWRQPITVIGMITNNNILNLQLEEFSPELLLKDFESIDKQVHFLSQTIDDFRNFFRPNKLPQQVTFGEIIREINAIMGKSFENHAIDLAFEGDSSIGLTTFKNELLQVFLNLFNNAKDAFVERNIPKAEIRFEAIDHPSSVLFLITDNAGGIPSEILNRIFEPYFSTKGEKNGTGIGLYMSSIIAETHLKGSLRVCVNNDETTFAVSIPKMTAQKVTDVY